MSTWTLANTKWETQKYSSRIQPRWVVDFFSDFWHVYPNPSLFSCFCWKKPEIENLTVMQDSSKKLLGNISPNRCFWNKRKRLQVFRRTYLIIKRLHAVFSIAIIPLQTFSTKRSREGSTPSIETFTQTTSGSTTSNFNSFKVMGEQNIHMDPF